MKNYCLSLAILAMAASTAVAAPGDQWILGIHHLDQGQGFTESVGEGYDGADGPHSSGNPNYFGNSYSHSGFAGDISRVYWELSGLSVNTNRPVPSTTEQYTIEYFGTPQPNSHDDFQPIESHFHGIVGEGNDGVPPSPSIDVHIPWVGQFGTNHQWLRTAPNIAGQWIATGPGPQAPDSEDYNAGGFGTRMWLTAGSWMYAKWDFPFEVDRAWSAIRLTQVTGDAPSDGDYNGDGIVDAADYVAWRKSNIDGPEGYDAWVASFGESVEGGGAGGAVPEPGILALLGLAGFVGVAWRRKR